MNVITACLLTVSLLSGCSSGKVDTIFSQFNDADIISEVKYAVGFDIFKKDNVSKLVIYVPGSKKEVMDTYYFVDEGNDNYESNNVFSYPMDNFAVFSATQLNAFYVLGSMDKVIAISESEYIRNREVIKLFNEGKIINLASNGNFFLEKALEISPKVVFYSPYNLSQKHPLAETKLKLIPFFDFMETDPLGRAEWIKFTALFTDQKELADSIFGEIEDSYLQYSMLTDTIEIRPTVFSDKYYNGQWFVPGGDSYIAKLFEDAGANYFWRDNHNTASVNLDFEVVFEKAHDADFWRIVGHYDDGFTYEKLGAENELYNNFDAFKNRNVIFCDSKFTTYFETGTLAPHVVLADLIYAFHPDLIPDYTPVYYKHYK